MVGNRRYRIVFVISVLVALALACSGQASTKPNNQDLESTAKALGLQATAILLQQMQATLNAPTITPPPPTAAPPTLPPPPEPTQAPPEPPAPVIATISPPTAEPILPSPSPTVDMKEKIRRANVLIFEDIWGTSGLSGNRRVSQAVQALNFSGGKVVNTGDALGDFKSQLLSGTPWDIVVISAESHNEVKGEFWEYIKPLVDKKVAVVAELWYMNQINRGLIMPLLSECGIDVQSNWYRDENKYNILDYSILNYDPSHPIFNTPNSGISLTNPSNIWWFGDVGDLVKQDVGGDAQILAGISYANKSDHGLITSCIEGRVIFQTFCTHDYSPKQTVALWQNYIVYTLTKHFEALAQ